MNDSFANPYWHSLLIGHAGIAIGSARARRFPADVIPFAGVPTPDAANMAALRDLLAPGETIYITGDKLASVPGLEHTGELPGWQMHFEATTPEPPAGSRPESPGQSDSHNQPAPIIRGLHAADAPAMVALTDVAFPGFFRARTYTLGRYFGIEIGGQLIAMAGERLALPGYREISAVCTHPAYIGLGHAAALIRHLIRVQAATSQRSFLHVVQANHRAIALYDRLGFTKTRSLLFHQLRRA